ncbi:sensor histidine kinase [Fulvivirga ulvae]|uniref:tetratricopeptide repeat-containing sensor histidine kinase n=1 Tax=Fulvivirga ulvae TaxID=2904245 RepID=UPI001F2CF31D|nr:tetratricopeptide repeat protein [Fulvivirga ulvae]UII32855.1 sensor histidine kinase [Fulvivirga ulvae]
MIATLRITIPLLLALCFYSPALGQEKSRQEVKLDSLFDEYVNVVHTSPVEAKLIADKILQISEENSYDIYAAKAHYLLGNLAYKKGEFSTTIEEINTAIDLLARNGVQKGLPACYNLLAVAYKNMGMLSEATEHFMSGLQLAKQLGDKRHEGNTYQNIALIYFQQQKYGQAMENLDRAKEIYEAINDQGGLIDIMFNYANIHKEQGNYEKAREQYLEVLAYFEGVEHYSKVAYVNINLSQMLVEEERYKEAVPLLKKTLQLLEKLNLHSDMAIVYNDLGLSNMNLGNLNVAIQYFDKALKIIDIDNPPYFTGEVYKNLSQLYRMKGDYKKALLYYEQYVAYEESVNSLEKEKYQEELEQEYETALKETRIALLEREKSLKEAELQKSELQEKRQRLVKNVFIAGFLLVLLTLIILRYFYVQKMKAQRRLAEQQEENSRQAINQLIKDYKLTVIERYQEGQEQERSRIAREIHDGIGSDLASLKMMLEHYLEHKGMDHNAGRIMTGIQNACKDIRNLSHQLHPLPFSQTGFSSFLKDFLVQKTNDGKLRINTFFFPEKDIDRLPDILLADVYRILQELVNNIVQHADAREAEVQLTLHEAYINIVVNDNGQGIPQGKKASGIGLRNIRERLEALAGTMSIESSEKGTLVNIDIPLINHSNIISDEEAA